MVVGVVLFSYLKRQTEKRDEMQFLSGDTSTSDIHTRHVVFGREELKGEGEVRVSLLFFFYFYRHNISPLRFLPFLSCRGLILVRPRLIVYVFMYLVY